MNRLVTLVATTVLCALGACTGGISKKPPIHPVLDMDFQQKHKAQSAAAFANWADGRGMRVPPAGTVARGSLQSAALALFKDGAGSFVANKLPASRANLLRGRERYDIVCSVCHDRAGSGKGLIIQRAPAGSFAPILPDLASEPRLVAMTDGELFETISNGKGTMPAYGHMVSPHDRWCIVHYLRALQHRLRN